MEWLRKLLGSEGAATPEQVVELYRGIGFFRGLETAALIANFERDRGEPPQFKSRWDDVYLLSYDREMAWCIDPEVGVTADREVYEQLLPQWAAVSQGVFEPRHVVETWEGERGPIIVRFELGRKQVKLTPRYLGDWIDMEVLKQINRALVGRDRRFECAVDGNFALVLCLTPVEKRLLQTRRRFPFAW